MTQKQLAENAGVEQSRISVIENGRRVPTAETFHRLLFACGFELVAQAREHEIPLPPPDDPFLFEPGGFDESPSITPETPMDRRAAAVTAVLAQPCRRCLRGPRADPIDRVRSAHRR